MKIKVIDCQINCDRLREAIRLAGHEIDGGEDYEAIYCGSFHPEIATGIQTIVDFHNFNDSIEVMKVRDGIVKFKNVALVRVPSLQCKTMLLGEDIEANKKIVIRPTGYDSNEFNMANRLSNPNSKFLVAIAVETSNPNAQILKALEGLSDEIKEDMNINFIVGSEFDRPIIQNADVVLAASSDFHPWGVLTLKCMASGAFPLVTDTEGIKMILHNEGIGNVFSNDSESIRQNILMAYTSWKQSSHYINNLGRKASKVARKYNWNKFVDLLVDDLTCLKEDM